MSVVAPAAYKERMKNSRHACYSDAWKQTQTTAANGPALSSLVDDHHEPRLLTPITDS